jgi:endo-1,4-beta-xylanase
MRKFTKTKPDQSLRKSVRNTLRPTKYHLLGLAVGIVLLLLTGFLLAQPKVFAPAHANQPPTSSDLSWLKLPGSSLTKAGLHITPLGEAIVNQDGSPNQTNPSVNLTGSHFDVSGDFAVHTKFKNAVSGGAELDFYGAVPVIYDEWRLETPRLSLAIYGQSVTATIWDGRKEVPVETRNFRASGTTEDLTVESRNDQIVVYIHDKQIGSISGRSIFTSGKVWIGANAKVGNGGWDLITLTMNGINKGAVTLTAAPSFVVKHDDAGSLRNLAGATKNKPKIGVAAALGPLVTDSTYRDLVGGQFSMLTPENVMKAQFIHPQPTVYNFTEADALVAFADANNMAVHGHALVFGEANPKWMQDTPARGREQVMTDHIKTVMGHFVGKVAEWDVVNEALADNNSNVGDSSDFRDTIWYRAMGEQFIDKAFTTAHATDPSAKLYINEYGLEADGERWKSMTALLTRLLARHVPVDGVGFQSHVYTSGDHEDPGVLRAHIEQLAKMGLMSRISEIDVHGEDTSLQASQYAGVLGACLAEPTCTSFTTWGITDLYGSTTEPHTYPPQYGDDLLWDTSFQPKPALGALQAALKK